jgi:hypothetical protein
MKLRRLVEFGMNGSTPRDRVVSKQGLKSKLGPARFSRKAVWN